MFAMIKTTLYYLKEEIRKTALQLILRGRGRGEDGDNVVADRELIQASTVDRLVLDDLGKTSSLGGGVGRCSKSLLKEAAVVLGARVGAGQRGSEGNGLVADGLLLILGRGLGELLGKSVQLGNTASLGVQGASSNTLGASLLVDKVDKVLLGASSVVVLDSAVGSKELDGGVTLDAVLLSSGSLDSGIEVGDSNSLLVVKEILSNLLISRG